MCVRLCGCSLNIVIKWEYTFSKGRALLKKMAASRNKIAEPPSICQRAENETRTRDPNLGKVVLYQLSYFRISASMTLVKRRRLELPRHNWHYPLKVARLPIPPPLHRSIWSLPECLFLNCGCKGTAFSWFIQIYSHFFWYSPLFYPFFLICMNYLPSCLFIYAINPSPLS